MGLEQYFRKIFHIVGGEGGGGVGDDTIYKWNYKNIGFVTCSTDMTTDSSEVNLSRWAADINTVATVVNDDKKEKQFHTQFVGMFISTSTYNFTYLLVMAH
jgi:hypothetical protein